MKNKKQLSKAKEYTASIARVKEIKKEREQKNWDVVNELEYEMEHLEQRIYTEKLKIKNINVYNQIKNECKNYGTDELTENLAFALRVQQPKNTKQLERICSFFHLAIVSELLDTGYCKNYGKAYGVANGKMIDAIYIGLKNHKNVDLYIKATDIEN